GIIYLYAAVGDASGHPVYPAITWTTSDPAVATVSTPTDKGAAMVTGRQAGVATIYATTSGLTDSLIVHVVMLGSVATVRIVPASATATVGESGVVLAAVVRDSAGHVLDAGASWFSSDTTVVFVYPCGSCSGDRALGRAAGMATVFATSQGKTGQATITVGPPAPVATVTVVPGSATLTSGDNATFTAQLRDAAGNILSNRSVSWSSTDNSVVMITSANGSSATSDPSVISVSGSGTLALVQPRAVGSAFLRATSEGKTGQATITVH